MKPMTFAKITAFTGGLVYFSLFLAQLLFARPFISFYSSGLGISNRTFFAVVLAVLFLVAAVNFCYGLFLNIREKSGEELKSALFYSFQLLIFPLILFIAAVVIFIGF